MTTACLRLTLVAALVLVPAPGAVAQVLPSDHEIADPSAPVVTEDNLLENERFWPYRVRLVEPLSLPGREQPLPVASPGVLVRVEPSGLVRVDFGSDGRVEIPLAQTDLVEQANAMREGRDFKAASNMAMAIGPRLMNTAGPTPRLMKLEEANVPPGFLGVFASPEDFAELAAALEPLHGRHGVWTVLYPQGDLDNVATRDRLRELGWKVPFLVDTYAEGYTRSRLGEGAAMPAVLLETREGRVIYRGAWGPDTAAEVAAALDRAFGPASIRAGR